MRLAVKYVDGSFSHLSVDDDPGYLDEIQGCITRGEVVRFVGSAGRSTLVNTRNVLYIEELK